MKRADFILGLGVGVVIGLASALVATRAISPKVQQADITPAPDPFPMRDFQKLAMKMPGTANDAPLIWPTQYTLPRVLKDNYGPRAVYPQLDEESPFLKLTPHKMNGITYYFMPLSGTTQ